MPKSTKPEDDLALPSFCRYRISAQPTGIWQQPEQFLQITESEAWNNTETRLDISQAQIYLRISGSTDTPKLVVHSHLDLLNNAYSCMQRLKIHDRDRVTIPVPIYHMYGLGAGFLPAVLAGAAIDLQKGANLITYLERERRFNSNIAFLVPSFCEALVKGRRASRTYQFTVVAGDRLQEKTFEKYESQFGQIIPLYGSTEMGAIAAVSLDDPSHVRLKTVGLPLPGVELCVTSASQSDGGELWCRNRWGFKGYVNVDGYLIEPKTEAMPGWFCTKDWGRIGEQGELEILGRSDQSVNRDGLLVFFADLERSIAAIPGVITVAVIAEGETARGKGLTAYCVVDPDQALTPAAIRAICLQSLSKRAVPDCIWIVEALDLLPNGKIDRQALMRRAAQVS